MIPCQGSGTGSHSDAPNISKEEIKAQRKAKAAAAKAAKLQKTQQKQKQETAEKQTETSSKSQQNDSPIGDRQSKSVSLPTDSPARSPPECPGGPVPGRSESAAVSASSPATSEAKPAEATAVVDESAGKTKAQLKAERRAKQEAQRAAKAAASAKATTATKASTPSAGSGVKTATNEPATAENVTAAKTNTSKVKTSKTSATVVGSNETRVKKSATSRVAGGRVERVLSALPHVDPTLAKLFHFNSSVHPAVVRVAVRMASSRLRGASACSVALLSALSQLVADYTAPARRSLRRHLPDVIGTAVQYLSQSAPTTPAVNHVIKRLERAIHTLVDDTMPEAEAKQRILDWIESFIEDNICKAMSAIVTFAGKKITDGDTIMTYGMSALVLDTLLSSHRSGCQFRVIVLDSEVAPAGRRLLRPLLGAGIDCTYSHLAAVSMHVQECSKVIVGAEAMLANGGALCAAGTALFCLSAQSFNRPVIICCETFKFTDRVFTDALHFNEIAEVPVKLRDSAVAGQHVLALTYDVTSPDVIDVVITELGTIPCTSVPAVLRMQAQQTF